MVFGAMVGCVIGLFIEIRRSEICGPLMANVLGGGNRERVLGRIVLLEREWMDRCVGTFVRVWEQYGPDGKIVPIGWGMNGCGITW